MAKQTAKRATQTSKAQTSKAQTSKAQTSKAQTSKAQTSTSTAKRATPTSKASAREKPKDSRTAILKAAVVEFARHGLSGTRLEHIAARPGFNKALVYRYFKSREELFETTLTWKFDHQLRVALAVPDDLGDALVYWFDNASRDRSFVQLIQREALGDGADGDTLAHEDFRRRYYDIQAADLEERKKKGQLDPALPTRPLLLLLSALVSFPAFLPNLTRLICGDDDDKNRHEWRALLRELAQRLGPAQPATKTPPP